MRVLTDCDGDFPSCSDEIDENKLNNMSLKKILSDNHTKQANKGEIFG